MVLHTCVSPDGHFVFGIHKTPFTVANQREQDFVANLGRQANNKPVTNHRNFPVTGFTVAEASSIFEIANQFPFRGATFIKKEWADKRAADPASIKLSPLPDTSLSESLGEIIGSDNSDKLDLAFRRLPQSLLLALATSSNDPHDLVRLARISCSFAEDKEGIPTGLLYEAPGTDFPRPAIHDHPLFEAVANNPGLPDRYKTVMALRPGAQGGSEIVGEFTAGETHVFEYLRRNSYIAGGHYAANMADDAVRYSVNDLTGHDLIGLRHLYYQRTFLRMAEQLDLAPVPERKTLAESELEDLRVLIAGRLAAKAGRPLQFNAALWGWNYGFDFAPTLYRLHASHQQIHQQFALIPGKIGAGEGSTRPAYACGDLVRDCADRFREETGRNFFDSLLTAILANTRTDGKKTGPQSLVIHQDKNILLFVPKAQTSQWELQLICRQQVGNIIEADASTRKSIDGAILVAMKTLGALGARMVTTIEFSKRFDSTDRDQRLLYSFLPKLPESPGAFSEAQLRWITGHYPEDFAEACRLAMRRIKY